MDSNKVLDFAKSLVSLVGVLIFGFLGLRILLKLFGANTGNDFVDFIYDTSQPLIAPFENIFETIRLDGAFIIEFSTIFALLVYALIIGFVLAGLDAFGSRKTTKKVVKTKKK